MHLQTPVKVILGLFVVAIVTTYSVFRFFEYVEGPTISIVTPQNGSTITEEFIKIAGNAENIARISLNGGEIFTTPAGHFREKLLLHPGYNAFQVKVTDRFGRVEVETLELVYQPDDYSQDGVTLTQKETENQDTSL